MALSGCGGGGTASQGGAEATAPVAAAPTHRERLTPRKRCRAQLSGFLAAMDRLRERLLVGVSYRQYIGELQGVRSYYDEMPVDRLRPACLSGPAASAERSFNRYLAAANAWSDCVEVPGCQAISIEAKLQGIWARGAKLLANAESQLSAD